MDAILNQLAPSIAYGKKFGKKPDFHYFHAPPEAMEKFDDLMRMAIERGKPLTPAEVEAAPAPVCGDTMEDGSWEEFLNTVRPPHTGVVV